jgi:preprotein translocase subunit SecE
VTKDATMTETDLPGERGRDDESGPSTPAPRSRTGGTGGGGMMQFPKDVALEMRRVSWPTRSEVASTTVVVLIAVVFFGIYIWGVDSLLAYVFTTLEGWLK